jgi:acyl-coenzyme A thioesterase 13
MASVEKDGTSFMEKVNRVLKVFRNTEQHSGPQLFGSRFIHISDFVSIETSGGRTAVTFKLTTEPWMQNARKIVHGGCTATMVDYLTTYAAAGIEKYYVDGLSDTEILTNILKDFGVSRHLSVQYLQAIPIGVDIYVECTLDSNTSRFIYTTCKIHDGNGKLYATAAHDKVKHVSSGRSSSSKL